MVRVYADLVVAGKYTTDPDKVTSDLKLVPASLRDAVIEELNNRGYFEEA